MAAFCERGQVTELLWAGQDRHRLARSKPSIQFIDTENRSPPYRGRSPPIEDCAAGDRGAVVRAAAAVLDGETTETALLSAA
jgi:hypothetical protein